MSEEKIGGGTGALTVILILVITTIGIAACGTIVYFMPVSTSTDTKTLTILHAWEEGGQYYFADELGCVYHIVCKENLWKQEGETRYDDMPKTRFDKLEEGQRYNVEYVIRQGNVRLSLSEKEMVR